jgi:hypothetical protein
MGVSLLKAGLLSESLETFEAAALTDAYDFSSFKTPTQFLPFRLQVKVRVEVSYWGTRSKTMVRDGEVSNISHKRI